MLISAELVRNHLDYTTWASKRLLAAAATLSPEELSRDFKTADHSILGTLAHIYAADRVWLARFTGAPGGPFITDADRSLAVLQSDWPALLERWRQWAQPLTDEATQQILSFKDTKGNPYSEPVWQLILHVVNHGSHHRGQVSGFLRALGHTPPPLDLVAYYRDRARVS